MADITVTAANVVAASAASKVHGVTAGATVSRGQPVYKDTSDSNEYKPCDANAEASAVAAGIALNDAGDGQPLSIVTSGDLDIGATLTVGEVYVVSATAGGVAPYSDLVSGEYVTILGVASAADNLKLDIQVSGATV